MKVTLLQLQNRVVTMELLKPLWVIMTPEEEILVDRCNWPPKSVWQRRPDVDIPDEAAKVATELLSLQEQMEAKQEQLLVLVKPVIKKSFPTA